MKKDTITFAIDGEVSIDVFASALNEFKNIVLGIQKEETSSKSIKWMLCDLQYSSAIASIAGIGPHIEDESAVLKIVNKCEEYSDELSKGKIDKYATLKKSAEKLVSLVDGVNVKSVRIETEEKESVIYNAKTSLTIVSQKTEFPTKSYGAIRGRIQSISSRTGLRFTLYNQLDDKAVGCYLGPGYEEKMREAWGKYAIVSGLITRDQIDGHPINIREISDVDIVPEDNPYTWRDAIGCAPDIL
jgi:hypothetical protein